MEASIGRGGGDDEEVRGNHCQETWGQDIERKHVVSCCRDVLTKDDN